MIPGGWPVVGLIVAVLVGRPWRHPSRGFEPAAPSPPGPLVPAGPEKRLPTRRSHPTRGPDRRVEVALPEVVDLILLGVGAGLSPRSTLARCREVVPAPFADAFDRAEQRWSAGVAFARALESALAPLGPPARPLLAALVSGPGDTTSLTAALLRVGDEARRRRRIAAQARARRLPVLLLLPLVFCVLPAFALVSLTPLVLASLQQLGVG